MGRKLTFLLGIAWIGTDIGIGVRVGVGVDRPLYWTRPFGGKATLP